MATAPRAERIRRVRHFAKPFFAAVIVLEKQGNGTRYTATAIHRDEAGRKQHVEMGSHQGWGTALDQLVAHCKKM